MWHKKKSPALGGTKFNARDESSTSRVVDRSLLPVDGANRAIKSSVIHRFPIRSILLNFAYLDVREATPLVQAGTHAL